MKIELKNIKHLESMSRETNCFTADIFVDGKKVGYAENDGGGGNTDCRHYEGFRDVLKRADEFCKSLPPIYSEEFDFTYEQNLESYVDDLLVKWLIVKDEKKYKKQLEKDSKKGICYKTENGYRIFGWTTHNLEDLLKFEKGREAVKKGLLELKERNVEILNTNIPQELYS